MRSTALRCRAFRTPQRTSVGPRPDVQIWDALHVFAVNPYVKKPGPSRA